MQSQDSLLQVNTLQLYTFMFEKLGINGVVRNFFHRELLREIKRNLDEEYTQLWN